MPVRDYAFLEITKSLCPICLLQIEAKIILQKNNIYLIKNCSEHGHFKTLISDDLEYYKLCRSLTKPAEIPYQFNTEIKYNCPYDCGLCPDHEQHSCLSVLEITDRCNLNCPTCYAASGPDVGYHRSLEQIDKMFDQIVANEKEPDIVQISGGEPTIHPHFFEILDRAKSRPIRHLMLNTNGVRIANDKNFAKKLANYMPGFEVYLQFDSLSPENIAALRGENLLESRLKALRHLNELNLSTTLVVTLQRGLNDGELGQIIDFALKQPCVRGVTFQPKQMAGRISQNNPDKNRFPLSEVRQNLISQCDWLQQNDVIPVPCNPDHIAMAYGLKTKTGIQPLTRYVDPVELAQGAKNTIVFETDKKLKEQIFGLYSTANSPETAFSKLKHLLCCLPGISAPNIKYENVFRIIILEFMDVWNLNVRSLKKSCVHIADTKGALIPFEIMNILHRPGHIEKLRNEMELKL